MSTVTYPATGQMLPDFHLPTVDGRRIRLSDYRNRRNIVLIVLKGLSAGTDRLLSEVTQAAEELADDNAQALVVVEGPIQAAQSLQQMYRLPFPVLADSVGAVAPLLGPDETGNSPCLAVHIASRSSRVYWSVWLGPDDRPPTVKDIRGWLEFIEIQCPECEAPEWS
ncbi:MAG: redoxin domain-containing protein [Anaerolineae bacterium]|nr:redoxin domain-containing protein [Anaerolineae bacterium]